MKKIIRNVMLWAAALLMAAGAGLTQGESAVRETAEPIVPALELPALASGTLVEIPITQDSRKKALSPREDCYIYTDDSGNPTGYADPSITVNLGQGRIYETNYTYARVKIAHASQMRTIMNSPLTSQDTDYASTIAKRVKAVVAINGDWPGGDSATRRTKGALMRQGKLLRMKCDGKLDVLVVDQQGDFHILKRASDEDVEALKDQAVNIFTFGPALVIDGQANYDSEEIDIAPNKGAQRTAICQTGPLEYLLITTEGPENAGSKGLTISQFVDLVSSIPEVNNAYNLDGGSSSTLVFRLDGKNWNKVNARSNPKIRPVKDIIYFATAWQ